MRSPVAEGEAERGVTVGMGGRVVKQGYSLVQ